MKAKLSPLNPKDYAFVHSWFNTVESLFEMARPDNGQKSHFSNEIFFFLSFFF